MVNAIKWCFLFSLAAILWQPSAAPADEVFPSAALQKTNPMADSRAVTGGDISLFAGQYPESFNYYLAANSFCAELFGQMYETLLDMDPLTAEYRPGLAARWAISDDKKTFTFWLDPRAKWSDGRPVTAEDVQWTFAAIMNPSNMTGPHKVTLEKFDPPVVVSNGCIRFTCREVHWRNLGAAGGFQILPRHVFGGMDFNKINFEFPVVSGPCRLAENKEGVRVRLERRADWWRREDPWTAHLGNFQTITYRFFAEAENAFEAFKKGQIDVYPVYTSRLWVEETRGERFDKNWIIRQRVENRRPSGFQGFAMNMRRPPFDDLRVRMAMANLLNREEMNRRLMYSQYFLHRSYYEDLYSKENPCRNPVFEFSPDKARKLLAEAGWAADPKTGYLKKDGRAFSFRFLNRDQSTEKFLTIYAEALKTAGIRMEIDRKDGAAWAKDMDEFNYDMTWAAWSEGLFKDPEPMWASREADRPAGNNITGFKDARVDQLIEKQKTLFDIQKRNAICREIDGLIAQQCPYVLLWNINAVRLLYWNKFDMPATVLGKFSDESAVTVLWWFDENAAADLTEAMESGLPLPARPETVVFENVFRPPQAP